ncbi:MAG: sulfite exporter TauE/SafE family protein [Alphaproteobacteria bacterium]|nr:sulfite exporter TauE/SafE family protein [Alphaproteobacteria bacterium]
MELFYIALLLLSLGVAGGFIAGLLGLGGGAIFVPGLYYILKHFGFHENAMHIAVGTSLLTIIFTGASSAFAHYKKGAVDLKLLRGFLPGVFLGVGIGTLLAGAVGTTILKIVFAASQIFFGSYMLLRVHKTHIFQTMPKQPWFTLIAAANACLATMMGVGGGVQNVTFMTICNVTIHRAIATAAAIGPFIAVFGALGFWYIGLEDTHLPPFSLGYLNLAAFGTIILTSMVFAPLGAMVAHSLPVPKLKRAFSVFMLMIAIKMLSEVFADFSI